MMPRDLRDRWFPWRALRAPWLFSVAAALALALGMVHESARVVRRAAALAGRVEAARAQFAAEAAVVAGSEARAAREPGPRLPAEVTRDGDGLRVEVGSGAGPTRHFTGRHLPGAAPDAFARALTGVGASVALHGGERLAAADVPCLDPAAVGAATRGDHAGLLRRDPGLALRCLQAGTDSDDYVFAQPAARLDPRAFGGLLVVPGNLWIEPGEAPQVLSLADDLVLVVRGNLYLGRSLRLEGPGRLLLVASVPPGSTPFVDADGNGRWAAGEPLLAPGPFRGPIEGAGNVYFGRRPGGGATIECAAGLCVEGELHLAAAARVAGPVVLAHGITAGAPDLRLHGAGEWCFQPARERIAGFVTRGVPRASLLRPAGEPGPLPTMRKQTLYLAAPAR